MMVFQVMSCLLIMFTCLKKSFLLTPVCKSQCTNIIYDIKFHLVFLTFVDCCGSAFDTAFAICSDFDGLLCLLILQVKVS